MADPDRDISETGVDEPTLRCFLSALSRIAEAETGAEARESSLHLLALFQNLDATDRERLVALGGSPLISMAASPGSVDGDAKGPTFAATIPGNALTPPPPSPPPPPPASPSSPIHEASPSHEALSGRYELIGIHARGGIGQVWKARDRQLSREVAVKELQPRVAYREDLRARFLIEAEITGRLEHPGIVPVYSLGEDEAGRPYYAMRFVRGHSLSQSIREFHRTRREAEAQGVDPSRAWGLEFRLLLRRFVGACETLEYAHSQRCIHRDLKPGNIMVGPYGETLVVDWGLGKILDVGTDPEPVASASEETDAQRTPTSATSPGDRIGTPQYMSPEQALGALERVGPRSDVYSLGATLFELLTGKLPFEGTEPHAVVVEVLQGARPPRSVLGSIPPALDAICRKAMAFRPEDRYASAGMLARDLENWLADEPVSARRETFRERASRWLRRHRTWAASGAMAMAVVSLTATLAAFAIDRSWRNESAARSQAESNFEDAQETVDKYLTRISQDELWSHQDSVDLRELRRGLLREALAYYEKFAREHAADDRLKAKLARAYENLGLIQMEIATPRDAIGSLEAAVAAWDATPARTTDGRGRVAERARALLKLGQARRLSGRPREALDALREAVEVLRRIVARPEGLATWGGELADGLSTMAAIQAKLGDPDGSLAFSAEARRILERLVADRPDTLGLVGRLAEVANNQGVVSQARRDLRAALRYYQECQAVCEARLATYLPPAPKPARLLELSGLGAANAGAVLAQTGRRKEAETSYLRSLEIYRNLCEAHPTVVRFRMQYGHVFSSLGDLRLALGRHEEALEALAKAREVFEAQSELAPNEPEVRGRLARALNTIGCIRDVREEHREALGEFQRAIEAYRRAITDAGELFELRYGLSHSLANLAEQYADLGESAPAREAWDAASRAAQEILRDPAAGPSHAPISLTLAATAGDVRLQAGEPEEAIVRFDEASAAVRESRILDESSREASLADLEVRRAAALIVAGRLDSADEVLERLAVELRGRGASAVATLSEVLWLRSEGARRAGRRGEADALAADRRALWEPRGAAALAAKAAALAQRAGLIGHGLTALPAAGAAARRLDADQAADDLRLALDLGFADRDRLRDDRDLMHALAGSRGRDLYDDLAFPTLPFAPSDVPSR